MCAGVMCREVKSRSCRVVHRNGFALVCWILQCFVMWGAMRPHSFFYSFLYIYYYMNKERLMSEYKSSKGGEHMGEIVIIEVPQGNEVICE